MYGTNFFLLPLYTRVLNPSDYGILDMIRIFESLALLTVALEINQGLGRYYMDESNPSKKASYFSTAFIFTAGCFVTFFVFSMVFSNGLATIILGQKEFTLQLKLGIVFISLNGILLLLYCQFRYDLRSKDYAIVSIITFLATSSLSVTLAYFLEWGLNGILISICVGNLTGLAVGFIKNLPNIKLSFDFLKLKQMLKFSFPLVPSGLAIFIHGYIDRMMINHYLTLNEVGLYGMGFRVAAITSIILAGFNRALSPLIISNYKNPQTPSQIAKIFRYFMCLSLLFFMSLSLFAEEILILLTTPEFYESKNIVVYLVPAILFSQMYMFAPGTSIAKKTHYIMIISILIAGINIILNFIFIPKLGFHGAAIATLLANFTLLVLHIFYGQKFYSIPYEWGRICISTIIAALMTIIILNFEYNTYMNWIIKISALALLPLILLLSSMINKSEIRVAFNSLASLFEQEKK